MATAASNAINPEISMTAGDSMSMSSVVLEVSLNADSDEENRSFRAEDDQNIAERHWQKYCAAGDRHESRKRLGI